MDEVIFQEFKGTGNSEIQLDRRLAERRVWPAVDILRSGTRKEEKLFPKEEFEGVVALRRALSGKRPDEAMQMLVQRLKEYPTNRQFLLSVAKKAQSLM
jgi:transcription termination factor Rho